MRNQRVKIVLCSSGRANVESFKFLVLLWICFYDGQDSENVLHESIGIYLRGQVTAIDERLSGQGGLGTYAKQANV